MPDYFVYWNKGRCNDGDHDSGLEQVADLDAAIRLKAEIQKTNFYGDWDTVRIIVGEELVK